MIINPMYFYKLRVFDLLTGTAFVLAIIGAIVSIIIALIGVSCVFDDDDYVDGMKFFKIAMLSFGITIVFWLLFIFIPDKETLIEMQIAKYATFENAEWTLDKLKEAVDYIVSKIGELK